jgi:long-chain acyl-CoA synthetase
MNVPKLDAPGVSTFAELPFYLASRYDRPAHLRRCVAGGFESFSTREFFARIRALSISLQDLGVQPGDRVSVVCESRPEWSIADFAILTAGAINVPVYPTLAASQTQFILADAAVKAVIVSDDVQLAKLVEIAPALPSVAAVVVIAPTLPLPAATPGGPVIRSLADMVAAGDERLARDPGLAGRYEARARQVRAGDVATIIYTSGTTGHPKGVVLTHDNILSNLMAVNAVMQIVDTDRPLSFLPLSHVFERLALYLFLLAGTSVTFAESLQTVARDLERVKPTVMTGVPRVFEKFHHAVLDAIAAAPGIRRALFHWATGIGKAIANARLDKRRPPILAAVQRPLADALVLKKVRSRIGGRLRIIVSGSAPLSRATLEFFYTLGMPVLDCYGLTECSPAITVNPPWAPRLGTVGVSVPGVEVRIADDGEILARGPNVMQGYYKRPEETAEVLRDGWLYTGDIGHLDADGYLTITDRKKDIIVTSGGKNIAPTPIELRLKGHPLVAEAVLLGDRRNFPAVLIVPNFALLEERLRTAGAPSGTREQLAARDDVQVFYQAILDEINTDLSQFEKIKRFALLPKEMTIEGGELTPTMKVRRKIVEERWAAVIEQLYAREQPAVL